MNGRLSKLHMPSYFTDLYREIHHSDDLPVVWARSWPHCRRIMFALGLILLTRMIIPEYGSVANKVNTHILKVNDALASINKYWKA